MQDSFFGLEQREMQKTAQRIIDEVKLESTGSFLSGESSLKILQHSMIQSNSSQDINPFVTQWEEEGMYPAAKVKTCLDF